MSDGLDRREVVVNGPKFLLTLGLSALLNSACNGKFSAEEIPEADRYSMVYRSHMDLYLANFSLDFESLERKLLANNIFSFSVNPDGSGVYFTYDIRGNDLPQGIHEINFGTKEIRQLTKDDDNYIEAISPDGSKLAITDRHREIYLYNLKDHTLITIPDTYGEKFYVNWSPDSQRIIWNDYIPAGGSESPVVGDIYQYTIGDKSPVNITNDSAKYNSDAVYIDTNTIAFVKKNKNKSSIWTVNVDGTNMQKITDVESIVDHLTVSPQQQFAFIDRETWNIDEPHRLLMLSPDSELTDLSQEFRDTWAVHVNDAIYSCKFSPDGRLLAFMDISSNNVDGYGFYRILIYDVMGKSPVQQVTRNIPFDYGSILAYEWVPQA